MAFGREAGDAGGDPAAQVALGFLQFLVRHALELMEGFELFGALQVEGAGERAVRDVGVFEAHAVFQDVRVLIFEIRDFDAPKMAQISKFLTPAAIIFRISFTCSAVRQCLRFLACVSLVAHRQFAGE